MNKTYESRIMGRNPKEVLRSGSFQANGSAAIVQTTRSRKDFVAARTGTGFFTITLDDRFVTLGGAIVTIAYAGGVPYGANINTITGSGSGPTSQTVISFSTFALSAPSTATDPPAGAVISFFVSFVDTLAGQ